MLRAPDGSMVVNRKPVRTRDYSIEIQRSGPSGLPSCYHNLHLVAIVLRGDPLVVRATRPVRLGAGEAYLRPAGRGEPVRWPEGISCLYVHLHPRLIRSLAAEPQVASPAWLQIHERLHDDVVRKIGFELNAAVQRPDPDQSVLDALVSTLARHVALRYPASGVVSPTVGRRTLEQVLDEFRDPSPGSGGIAAIATSCGLSRAHFSRRIHCLTGHWPQTILLGSRIEAAKHLLERDAGSLSEVAYASGFADQSHLTRVFHRATGLTPARYRSGCRSLPS